MVYLDLPPEFATDPRPLAPPCPGSSPLAPKKAWRREGLLQHLKDPTVVAETAGLLEQQAGDIYHAFKPRNGWQEWLTSTIATIMLRINRSERIERKLRDWASYRAIDFWEDDQKLAVETLAIRIGREPARTLAKLRETPAGIDWLLARWRLLARVEPQAWTDEHREVAERLLGGNENRIDPARPGFVALTIAGLEAYRGRVVEADAIARGLVEADLNDDAVPGLARLRRYVRSLQRQLKWYVDQFHVEHPDRWDDPRRRPAVYGPAVEAFRPPNPNHFEGATPTPPQATVAAAAPRNDETKPLLVAATPPVVATPVPEVVPSAVAVTSGTSRFAIETVGVRQL